MVGMLVVFWVTDLSALRFMLCLCFLLHRRYKITWYTVVERLRRRGK
uniref:Uncharacterized protein n=1 Tax=Arundo donax TaxID=35708 RepID=A0A0A9BAL4_ARUDO